MYQLKPIYIKSGTTLSVGPSSEGKRKVVYRGAKADSHDGSVMHELELVEGKGRKRPVKVLFKPDLSWGDRWLVSFVQNGVEPDFTELLAVKALARLYGLTLMASLPAGYNTLIFRRKRAVCEN